MNRDKVLQIISDKVLTTDWHFLHYHFSPYKDGYEHFLCASMVDACTRIEAVIEGYTEEFASRLASFSDREMYVPHFEQIVQLLAELFVIQHLALLELPDAIFAHEPSSTTSDKNPEVGIEVSDKRIFVEVKCREFISHNNNRGEAAVEVPARMDGIKELAESMVNDDETLVYPRDNLVKDFLVSANEKFEGIKKDYHNAISVLVIVWDDFIYEPISSLLNSASGLITENSFYVNGNNPVVFKYIDAVIVVRQSHHIVRATRNQLPIDGLMNPLNWGKKNSVLPKAYIPVSTTPEIDGYLCDIFQAHHIEELQAIAEYRPQQIVLGI